MTPSTKQALLASAWVVSVGAALLLDRQWGRSPAPAGAPGTPTVAEAPPPPAPLGATDAAARADGTAGPEGETNAATTALALQDSRPFNERASALFGIEDPVERMSAFLKLIRELKTNEDRTAVLDAMMGGFEPRDRGREFGMLMTEWVKSDPVAALEYTKKLEGWRARVGATTALVAWAQKNPAAALEWARANGNNDPKNEEGNMYLVGALTGYAKTNLDAAAALALELPRSEARGQIMDRLLDGFAKRGDGQAEQWIASLPDGAFRQSVTNRLAERLADADPQASVAFLDRQPAGNWKTEAYTDAIENWSERDPNAAGAWLARWPRGPESDDPRRAFAWNIREQDPESAMAWAGTISDNRRRDRMMVELARDWYKREPQAAQDFITRQGWPEQVRRRVAN